MACEIGWLESAQNELNAEIEYVLGEFGENTAKRVQLKVKEVVDQLEVFPNSGARYDGCLYHGHEVRMAHVQPLTIFYSYDEVSHVTILAIWNNYQNPDKITRILNSK